MRLILLIILSSVFVIGCATTKQGNSVEDLKAQLVELQNANAYSNSKLEELSSRLFALQEDVDANRLALLEKKETLQNQAVAKKIVGETKQQKKRIAKSKVKKQNTSHYFNKGLKLFKQKKYTQALNTFNAFLSGNPRSRLKADAYYWMGEIHYEQNAYKKAIMYYKRIPEEYPGSARIDAAILKLGFCHLKAGDKTQARAKFKEILEIYPNTASALIAKKQIEELK